MNKRFNSDLIFMIGVFLLPFENFFFAPSSGWATITPIIFATYIMFNLNTEILKKTLSKSGWILILSALFNILAYLIVGINLENVLNAFISIGLGFVNLISMYIYYSKNKDLNKIIKIVMISYSITLIIGLIEFITIKFNITVLYNFFDIIFKRNYMVNNRVQFFFTEPSFIGMHMFGILLPLYLFSKDKKVLGLIITYTATSIIFNSGVRIIIDMVAVAAIFTIYQIIKKKKYILLIILPAILVLTITIAYNNNYRIKIIMDKGIYADGSLASRYFRIQSSIYGYIKDFPQVLVGYGIGNSLIPLRSGYEQAKEEYKSSYMREVNELGDSDFNNDSVSYCLYIRLISELGLIIFCLLMYYLLKITKKSVFKYKWPYLLTVLYIYLQFESYAFYAIWIYVLAMTFTQKGYLIEGRNENEEY